MGVLLGVLVTPCAACYLFTGTVSFSYLLSLVLDAATVLGLYCFYAAGNCFYAVGNSFYTSYFAGKFED